MLPLPLLFGEPPRPIDAAVAGAAAALCLAGSPLAAAPLALGVAASTLLTPRESLLGRLTAFVSGAGAAAACVVAWLLRFADPAGFREEFLRFNSVFYAHFMGNPKSPADVIWGSAKEWGQYLNHAIREFLAGNIQALLLPLILAVMGLVAFTSFRWRGAIRSAGRATAVAALLTAMFLCLRILRGGDFRAIPLHLAIFAAAAVLPWAGSFRRPQLVAAILALLLIPALSATVRHESFRFHEDSRLAADGGWLNAARYIEAHTKPDERIASFPLMPSVYLEAKRRPAADSIYYLPWQAAWEAATPGRTITCAQLRAHPPSFVTFQDAAIWGVFPWKDYASCVDAFLKSDYEAVEGPEFGGLLLKRKGAARP